MTDDRDTPTPRESRRWSFFADLADQLAARLDEVATLKSTPTRLDLYDRHGAERARMLARTLRILRDRFNEWPTLDAETVAAEHTPRTKQLFELQREAEELCTSTPRTLPPRTT